MEQRGVCVCGAVFLALLSAARAAEVPVYFQQGGELELKPPVSATIKNIAWKLNGDLVADWEEGLTTYYGRFKGRTTLDATTGVLKLSNMDAKDQGLFGLEVNDRVHDSTYKATMIRGVPTPEVRITPLACDVHADSCMANCEAKGGEKTEGAEPITYSWILDGGGWTEGKKNMPITKAETKHVQLLSCQMRNPVDQKDSESLQNPLYEKPPPPPPPYWIAAPVIICILAAVGVGVGVVVKKKPELVRNLLNRGEAPPARNAKPRDQPNTAGLLPKAEDDTANGSGSV